MWVDEDDGDDSSGKPSGLVESIYVTPAEMGKTEKLRIVSLNARSINNKWQQIRDLVHNASPTILCIQETWGKRPQVDYSIKGFQRPEFSVRQGEGMNLGGGVAIWVSENMRYESLSSPVIDKTIETQTILIPSIGTLLLNCYCPFGDKGTFIQMFTKHIKDIMGKYPNHDLIVVGDFNMDLLTPGKHANELVDYMANNGLLQHITLPTRVENQSTSLIDHIYTKSKTKFSSAVITTDISDHCPTVLTAAETKSSMKGQNVTKRWLTDESYLQLKENLANIDWKELEDLNLDEATEKLHAMIVQELDKISPIETRFVKPKPINTWLTKGLKISSETSDKMYKKVKKGTLDKEKHKHYKKILDSTIKLARNMKYQDTITSAGNSSRKLWQIVNEITDRKQVRDKAPSTLKSDGQEIKGYKNVANEFNKYFACIGQKMANSIQNESGFEDYIRICPYSTKFELRRLEESEVGAIMKRQMPKLSTGIDDINNRIVKTCWEELMKPMTSIINRSIELSRVPALHKKAKITPLYKKGNKQETGNYRPVSLLPALSKILEKAVCQQVMRFLNKNQLLCPNQFGFRTRNQTTHVVHSLLNTVAENAINNHCTIATFIDLSKAFDCLQYDKLYKKMEGLNFADSTINWFKSYLSDRKQCVAVEGELSDWLPMELGVPQGSILGPVLFLMYINDINKSDQTAKFVKFADDTTILISAPTAEEAADKMNKTLERVYKWFRQNKLNLNPSKTRYMIFNSKTEKQDLVKINDEPIIRVWNKGKEKSFKLVGIHLDEKLNWNEHITTIAKKITAATYGLHKAGKDLDCKRRKLLYSGLIHSHLTYGLPIWGHATQGRLNTLLVKQKKAIRQVFRLKYNTHTLPYFVKGNILQLPELVRHSTLCYVQSGLENNSPFHVKALWRPRLQQQIQLRQRGIILDFPVTAKEWINRLPLICQAKLWNNQPYDKEVKERSRQAYKAHVKFDLINSYFDHLSVEELIMIGEGTGIMEDENQGM
jgi:hypothetical protein